MCQKCEKAIRQAVKNGVSEEVAINWLWENTPFPIGTPTKEQYKKLEKFIRRLSAN